MWACAFFTDDQLKSGRKDIFGPYFSPNDDIASQSVPQRSHPSTCTFQILGGCQGRRTGVGVTTVSNSLIFGGWVTKVLNNGDKK